METDWSKPIEVSQVDMAFGGNAMKLMPSYEELRGIKVDSKWSRLFSEWFYNGLESLEVEPKDGIDKNKALRQIKTVMGSFDPKHEHKEAGVAFLMSQFFKDAKWTSKKFELKK
jgi:hypothetical protein